MKFFHTADIHFGVENYGKIDPQTGIHSRLWDFYKSLEQCVDHAIAEQIDFFLFCGDAYKTAYPTPTQQKLLVTLLLKLHQANIPVVIVVGNHDHPLSFGKANALDVFDYLPVDGFHVFSKPDVLRLTTKSGLVQIVGIPWPTRNHLVATEQFRYKTNVELAAGISEKVGQIITTFAATLDPMLPAVLASHLTVSSGIFSGSEKCAVLGTDPLFLPSQLAIPPFDYVALGHLHRHQNLNSKGHPPVVYAGSIERVDFGERKEEKGFCRVVIKHDGQGKKQTVYDFIHVKTRPMVQIEVTLEPNKDATTQLLDAISQYDLQEAIVKVIYHVPTEKQDKIDLLAIQRACAAAHYIVGVIPVYKAATREKRAALKVDMDFHTLLDKYFDAKEIVPARKTELLEKAKKLEVSDSGSASSAE